jgi:low temperature requirement protein LtrA
VFRGILVALYVRAYRHAAEARPLIRRYGSVYAFSVALWLVSAALPASWSPVMWAVAILLDLSMPPLNTRLHRNIPVDPAHVPERFGLFSLIVLGELVVSVGSGTMDATWSPGVVAVAVAGFGIAACLWWVYFERLTGQELQHAARPIVTFAYAHLPLLAALMFIAGGVSLLVRGDAGHGGPAGAWALCGGVAAFLAALNVAQAQLTTPPMRPVFVARWLVAAAMLAIPLAGHSALAVTVAALVLLVALVVFEGVMCGPPERAASEPGSAREIS